VNVLVDTSVWSLALRRDGATSCPEVEALSACLRGQGSVITTGLILQELLQGFHGPTHRREILSRFAMLPLLSPGRDTHVEAASLRNSCRRRGVQVGTIDVLIAQLCIQHDCSLLTTDRDFQAIARLSALQVLKV
jgi:hypothetical protein